MVVLLIGSYIVNVLLLNVRTGIHAWITIYGLAYFYTNLSRMWRYNILTILCGFSTGLLFSFSWLNILDVTSVYSQLFHTIGGLFCTLVIFELHAFIPQSLTLKLRILPFSDKYSYEVYLVHHVFILGIIPIIGMTSNLGIDIACVVPVIIVYSVLLRNLSDKIGNRISQFC